MSPNPLVGAVLVKDGRAVARGYHHRFGGPHAEVECLRSYKGNMRNTTLYVNLEPCTHYGKTPPCVDLVIDSGIRHVVIAMKDPNPLVAGRGIRELRRAGVRVTTDVMEGEARELNRAFIVNMTKRRPFVHMKIAQTLDGKIALDRRSSTQITSSKSLKLVHRWRTEHDAVLVGAGTIHADDPLLNVRLVKGRDPAVVILDGNLSLNSSHRIFRSAQHRRVIVFAANHVAIRKRRAIQALALAGVRIVTVESRNTRLPVKSILRKLSQLDVNSVLVEGGARVFSQFLNAGLVDRLSVFIAPRVLREGVPAFDETLLSLRQTHPYSGGELTGQQVGVDVLLQCNFD